MTRKEWNRLREKYYDWYYNLRKEGFSEEFWIILGTGKSLIYNNESYEYLIVKEIKFWGYDYIDVKFYTTKSLNNLYINNTIRAKIKWNKISNILGVNELQ